jgi:Uma2 family endonuclease
MGEPILKEKRYTFADYMTWTGKERYELINGDPVLMSPAPARLHQSIGGELFTQLNTFLKGKQCKAFYAPFDVRLNPDDGDDTIVQPDISVVCDRSKLDDHGCVGAPDFIIEILSPSTDRHDRLVKFNLYLHAGVREYWIVDPVNRYVLAHILDNGRYISNVYGDTDQLPVHTLAGCVINLNDVFAED